jgi:hypothetical protein
MGLPDTRSKKSLRYPMSGPFPPRAIALEEERQCDQAGRSGLNCGRHETRAIETTLVSAVGVGFPFAAREERLSTSKHRLDSSP